MWSDAGVEGAHRFLQPAVGVRAGACRRASHARRTPIDWTRAPAALRRGRAPRAASALKQADVRLRAHPVQHGRVRRHEDAERARGDAGRRRRRAAELAREGLSILLRVLYPVVPHTHLRAVGANSATPREFGDLLDAPWPKVDAAALAQDEIELVLQVNGKLRGKLRVPATADTPRSRARRARAPKSQKHGNGAPIKKVIVVPGKARQCRRLSAPVAAAPTRSIGLARLVVALVLSGGPSLRLPPARRGALPVRDAVPQFARRAAVRPPSCSAFARGRRQRQARRHAADRRR